MMTEEFSMATGGNTDPFYQSTGKRKDVTIDGVTYKNTLDVGSTKPPAAKGIGSISPATGLEITGNERNLAKEKEAMGIGYTKEYIASRGGINSEGYFNDTPLTGQITPEERKSVTKTDGTIDSTAMLDILNKKSGGTGVGTGDGTGDGTGGVKKNIGGVNDASRSAYDLVTSELTRLGLPSLIAPLRSLFESGISEGDSLRLALSQTPEYQTRFSANAKRIGAGLSALSPAEYIQLEDQYQNIMRNYGLPASYYAKDATGKQIGFDELLGGDVSATELEERLITAQDRVLKSNPEVLKTLKAFYPGIGNGDILAYSLDPKNALKDIQRKVAAAEIGGAALAQGLSTTMTGAEELAGYGITKAQAQQGFADVAQMAPRGGLLSEIYNEAPYNQATATAEVFGTAGAAEAAQKRRKLTALEEATFSGQSGLGQGALARNGGGGAF
jgi:hypothetical protein